MEVLIIGLQAFKNFDGILNRGLIHIDLLEPANEGTVLFEVLTELLIGRRAHAPQSAGREGRLEQVRGIHGPARRRARTDHRMDLVDEQDGVGVSLQLLHHLLDPLFKITAIAGSGQQRAHIEAEDGGPVQNLWNLMVDDLARQALSDGRLADARITNQQRIVLGPAAEDLDGPINLSRAANQGVNLALTRLLIEIDAIGL